MATQFDFTNDDWDHVATTPVLVGMAVAKAEDSGFLGSIRETRALLATMAEGSEDNPARTLIDQAAATETSVDLDDLKRRSADALATDAEAACARLAELLPEVAEPDVGDGYKRWILELAAAVAEAAKEDGQLISPGEVEVIGRVSAALGYDR
ncbi:MAG: hypothetical protein AAFO29_17460 [Actinomycetota bacterium]